MSLILTKTITRSNVNRPKSLPWKGLGRRGRGEIVASPYVTGVYVDIKKLCKNITEGVDFWPIYGIMVV